jgi:arabinan endo-1,5-alpha-L-arabinosidase
MDLHVRRLFFTTQGWPSVSPERYAGEKLSNSIHREMLFGEWEIIRIHDSGARANLQAGQVSDSELLSSEVNHSFHINLTSSGNISLSMKGKWSYNNEQLTLELENEKISHLVVFNGHDWENETRTLLFTGSDENGCSVWGKRIK